MKSFCHKWIFYALSVLVAALATFESTRLLLLNGVLGLFCRYKKITTTHILAIMLVGLLSFIYFSYEKKQLTEPLLLPTSLTWTHEYKMNGDTLRGFMKDKKDRKVYVVYTFKSEREKNKFEQMSLVGKEFLIRGELKEPSIPAHRYSFNMANYLKSKGAIGTVEIKDWTFMKTKQTFSQKVYTQRFKVKQHIEATFPQSLVGEAQALLIGLQDNVEDDMTKAYQRLGITHLFAISGLHIAIISFTIHQGMLRLTVRKELATIVLLVLLPIYALLAGGAPSVWRAVVVVELILISRIRWHLSIDDALAICFILFVLYEPWSIYQIGFQLSYLATASLIYSGKILNRCSSWIVKSFMITFVCQLLVYPLLLFHFYEISLSSFVVNIFFVPLFSFIILPINLLLFFVSYIPGRKFDLLFALYEPCRMWLTKLIELLQSIPNQVWNPGKPTTVLLLIAFASVLAALYFLECEYRMVKSAMVLFVPVLAILLHGKFHDDLVMTFIDVGQGDAILIELPNREAVYLIDTGGIIRFGEEKWREKDKSYEVGRQVVVPYLKGKGIQKIDKLILTHADADHIEGAEEILQEITVKEIHVTPNSYQKETLRDVMEEARIQKIPVHEKMAGHSWKMGDVLFEYLWPLDRHYEGNNDSLVLLISQEHFKALLPGDLEKEGEESLLVENKILDHIDLLKAGHHGSKTSSSEIFLERLVPTLTIFSAGENNRYGHPHKEVVERYRSMGLRTVSTSEYGTIVVKVKDGKMKMLTSSKGP